MARLGQTEVKKRPLRFQKYSADFLAPRQMITMRTPGRDDVVGPKCARFQLGVILRPDGMRRGPQPLWICLAPCKKVGHSKPAVPKRTGSALAALDRWIVAELCRFRWVEHHEIHAPALRIPDARQGIAVSVTFGIGRRRACGLRDMRTRDHDPEMPAGGRVVQEPASGRSASAETLLPVA